MKFTVAASLVASVAGFAPSAMKGQSTKLAAEWGPSEALPFDKAPPTLDGSMVGDVGFDPFGLSTIPLNPILKDAGSDAVKDISDLNWLREAELMHGRIAQLAVVGFIWPGAFGTFPGNEWTGVDAYSTINPLEALGAAPTFAIVQIFTFMTVLERRRVIIMSEEGANYVPGDQRFGQFGWNPFGLNYSPEEFEEKRLQELKHCRLAMIGIFGLWAQASVSGMSVAEQYAGAFNAPDYWARAGYFLPEGI